MLLCAAAHVGEPRHGCHGVHQVLLDAAFITLVQDTAHVVLYIVLGKLVSQVSEVLAHAFLALVFVDVLQAVAVAGRRRQLCDLLAWDLGALPPDTSLTAGVLQSRIVATEVSTHALLVPCLWATCWQCCAGRSRQTVTCGSRAAWLFSSFVVCRCAAPIWSGLSRRSYMEWSLLGVCRLLIAAPRTVSTKKRPTRDAHRYFGAWRRRI